MDHHGRFNPVVWDLNMSFGSFRFSDGSYHFQGLTIDQAMKLDPLQHLIFSISPRPLLTNLLQDPTLKRKYIAHLRTIMKEQFESGRYLQQAQMWRDLITKDVQEDTNKFYSFSDYIDNVDVTVGGTGGMGAYPGIKYLVEGRIAYLSDYPGFTGEPVIIPGALLQRPYRGETAFITAEVSGGDEVWLHCRQSAADLFEEMRMYDDGLHGDGVAGDGIYGAGVVVSDDIIHYYFYAQNDSAGVFSPERAETSFYTVCPLVAEGVLVFNEVSPPGNAAMTGTAPARDGWIEIYNNSRDSVSLQGLWIEQCISALAWALPDSILPPGRFLLISVDGKTADALHAPALLSVPDGVLRLFYPGGIVVDSLSYCYIQGNTTLGRYPNGAGSFTLMPPTCGFRNAMGDISRHCLSVAPNPAIDHFDFAYLPETPRFSYKLLSSDGRVWFAEEFDAALPDIPVSVRVDISRFPQGIYFLHLTADTGNYSTKIIIIK